MCILEQLIEGGRPMSVTDMAAVVHLPRPTVSRLVHLLENRGFLLRNLSDRKYVPGPRMEKLALAMAQGKLAGAAQRMTLETAVETLGETCHVVMLDGHRLTCLGGVEVESPLRLNFDAGTHIPIHCTAPGKLLLAVQRKRVRTSILRRLRLQPMTGRTIVDPVAFEQELDETRARGFGVDDEEYLTGMVGVAVPIEPPTGEPVAAVLTHAPAFRRSVEELRGFLPQLRQTAQRLSTLCYLENATLQVAVSSSA